ncbi:helix-turn-helix domain-containing protein [Kordiimonas laminariae]|uniref:helix-turn-helix domain-containing protein n=1 Tax=Kordiimonas laminariae TaxID=2917717 RepID=UPI001FF68728|nr:hypothetical protein [Kordiimonas laminariae]MCK0069417.1 hypothetical protein [Kordiimonas laminariae]
MAQIKPINDVYDYRRAIVRIAVLMDEMSDDRENDEFEILSILVEAYEEKHFSMGIVDPVTAIEFVMEQKGFDHNDLAMILDVKKPEDILNGSRSLSISEARILHKEWGIPADTLLA